MHRYFIEVSYRGTGYAGFQAQKNANTIQGEVEHALHTFYRQPFELTGSSRTDAGVHALQNFFHVDTTAFEGRNDVSRDVYHLNAILPSGIVIKSIQKVDINCHARFSALSRSYRYTIYNNKDPFISDTAYFYPYPLNLNVLNEVAEMLKEYEDFESFAKKNSQVHTFNCTINSSCWRQDENKIIYEINGNRFLRGMVRGLVGTMLRVGAGKASTADFRNIIASKNSSRVDFSAPAHGLTLMAVQY